MDGYGMIFPAPTEEQRRALAVASAYLKRMSTQAASRLLVDGPEQSELALLQEFRGQLAQSAGTIATLLEVFDGWPGAEPC